MKLISPPYRELGKCITAGRTVTKDGHYFEREAGFKYWTVGGALKGERSGGPRGGEMFKRDANTFSMAEPDTAYVATHPKEYVETLWVIFAPGELMMPYLNWPCYAPGLRARRVEDAKLRASAMDALGQAVEAMHMAHPQHEALAANALMRFFLLLHAQNASQAHARRDVRVAAAMEAIHGDPARAWTVAELARKAHMSESSLAHRFTEETGMSPVRYAQERRMAKAKEMLLMSNEPIGVIAESLGFVNAFHFSTRFRKVTGQSPRAYRSQGGA